MINLLIYILFLTIYNSILFFEKELGLSVILFNIPLLAFIYYILKKQNLIKNKKGLLFIIPIVLLSLTYLIFNNDFFNTINILAIPVLFALMYIYTINPTFNLKNLTLNILNIFIKPLSHISNIYNLLTENITKKLKISKKAIKVFKSIIIVLPVTIVILLLLSSADQIFSSIFSSFFELFNKISLPQILTNFIKRLIPIILLFFYLAATINFLLYNFSKTKYEEKNFSIKLDQFTIKLLLTTLNIIYVIFDIIQIRSLIFHQISMNISYAEYARQGFFQLMFVSFINLIIILISKNIEKNSSEKTHNYLKTMNLIMVFLTLIIIVSSFLRMYMYECAYGYTLLRLLVYFSLITEVILLIPTIIYILNSKFNIVKHFIIILVTAYTIINFVNVDYLIAKRNINRYNKVDNIDIYYLMNHTTDNVSQLIELYNSTDDIELKQEISNYLNKLNTKTTSITEFNFSKYSATKQIEKFKD